MRVDLQDRVAPPPRAVGLQHRDRQAVIATDQDRHRAPVKDLFHCAEDAGAVRIGVVRCDDGDIPVTVAYATSDLTATSGVDYTGVASTLMAGLISSFWRDATLS